MKTEITNLLIKIALTVFSITLISISIYISVKFKVNILNIGKVKVIINQFFKDSHEKSIKNRINSIIDSANNHLYDELKQHNSERSNIISRFKKQNNLKSEDHIKEHIKNVNSFINLLDNYVANVKGRIYDLLATIGIDDYKYVNSLRDFSYGFDLDI